MITLLVVMVPVALGTLVAQQGGNFLVSVAGTAVGSIPHQIDLKVTLLPGGQLSQVTGFIISPEDVIQVKQGENIIVSTSADLRIHQVTVRNMQGIPIDLVPLPSNAWSLQGLLPGVYSLDVNVAMSSSGILGTYETILVILEPNQQPLPPTTIINQITIRPPPKPTPEPCPPGTTGFAPNCEPIPICDVENPPPECEEPSIECPDGSIVPPGEECPEPPSDEPPSDEEEESEDEESSSEDDEEDNSSDDEIPQFG